MQSRLRIYALSAMAEKVVPIRSLSISSRKAKLLKNSSLSGNAYLVRSKTRDPLFAHKVMHLFCGQRPTVEAR